MFQNRKLGTTLIVVGVLANNNVYLHDLIFGTYEPQLEGAFVLGWVADFTTIATPVATAMGLVIVMRSPAPAGITQLAPIEVN